MHLFLKITSLTALSIFSINALAGGEPVNCRMEITGYQNFYGGYAQCNDEYTINTCKPKLNGYDLISENKSYTLSEDVVKHNRSTITLSEYISYYENTGYGPNACTIPTKTTELLSCSADLDFISREPVKENVCDYVPTAKLNINHFSYGEVSISLAGSDSDGSVVNKSLKIDGSLQGSSSVYLNGYIGQTFFVEGAVTDNDGYTVRKTIYVTLEDNGYIGPLK